MAVSHSKDQLPVAVVGAGFSGTLLAINLARQGRNVVLIERDDAQLAKGLAFGTRRPEHLLNVRASNMSAYPDDAGHFVRWLGFSDTERANRFVPRLAYGQYLREQLVAGLAAQGSRLRIHADTVVGAQFTDGAARLLLKKGKPVDCSAVVLALGNFPPQEHHLLSQLPQTVHFANPWAPGAVDGLDQSADVLLLGTGLTAVDVILSLATKGFTGRIIALSRRGLQPRAHAASGPAIGTTPRPDRNGSRLLRAVRERSRQVDWREAVDELRFHTQALWRRQDVAAQARFLRHLRPYWDVHRHRLAPAVAAKLAELQDAGRLEFLAGKLVDAKPEGAGARLGWRARGSEQIETALVGRVINCTGPEGDLSRTSDPLLRGLLEQGLIRPDIHRLGLDVDHVCRVRTASGAPHDRLFAVGPLTKGEAWEIIAVPDIRSQVWNLARRLALTHWVEGEGL